MLSVDQIERFFRLTIHIVWKPGVYWKCFLLFGFLDFSNFKHNVIAGNLNISVLLVFETHRVIGGEKTLP